MRKIKIHTKKAQMNILVGLLFGFIIITTLIALIPGLVDMIDIGLGSEGLNCKGFVDVDSSDGNTTYNSTVGTKSSVGCLAMKLFIPYILLAVLIGVVTKIIYDRGQQSPVYG